MIVPSGQYLNAITSEYIKKIFDFDIEEISIDKLFYIILQNHLTNYL